MKLAALEALLKKPLKEIFGDDADGINAKERELSILCHPDRFEGTAEQPLAARLFKLIHTLADDARRPPITLKGKKHEYAMRERLWTGDLADVHAGTADSLDVVLKVSRFAGAEEALATEAEAVTKLQEEAGDDTYSKYLPTLVESIQIRDKFPRRVNVFHRHTGFYSLADVLAKHKRLDGRHLGWIFKRLTTILGFIHAKKWVHGAILPQHILLHPANHGLMLVGWGQAVQAGKPLRWVVNTHKDWYPPEVAAKKPATPGTDIYMAAKCAEHLVGTVPEQFKGLLAACQLSGQRMRFSDAWNLNDEFSEILRRVYGPPKFHVLSMT